MAANLPLNLPRLLWWNLVSALRVRGEGRRESGAFLMGSANSDDRRIMMFVCYDDLDPECLVGSIQFHADGYSALWRLCSEKRVRVLADIHTHPDSGVDQSPIDSKNPMLPVPGHVGLIAPNFGRTSKLSLAGVGMHVFGGRGNWTSHTHRSAQAPIRLTWW